MNVCSLCRIVTSEECVRNSAGSIQSILLAACSLQRTDAHKEENKIPVYLYVHFFTYQMISVKLFSPLWIKSYQLLSDSQVPPSNEKKNKKSCLASRRFKNRSSAGHEIKLRASGGSSGCSYRPLTQS